LAFFLPYTNRFTHIPNGSTGHQTAIAVILPERNIYHRFLFRHFPSSSLLLLLLIYNIINALAKCQNSTCVSPSPEFKTTYNTVSVGILWNIISLRTHDDVYIAHNIILYVIKMTNAKKNCGDDNDNVADCVRMWREEDVIIYRHIYIHMDT